MEHKEIYWKGVTQPRGKWHEGCELVPIPTKTGLPDFRLQIWMEDASSGQHLTRLTISVHPDEEVWSHYLNHPLWKCDPRPLVIESLREVMWKVKLCRAEPESPFQIKMAVQYRQGGTINMILKAEVLYDSGGSTILHLVNYANTHLLDLHKKLFRQIPNAKPILKHFIRLKAEYDAELEARHSLRREEKKKLLSSRPTNTGELAVFIDESGDIGLRTPVELYISTATVLPSTNLHTVRDELKSIIVDNWPGNSQPNELHFSKIPETKLPSVLSAMASCLCNNAGYVTVSTGRKDNFLFHLLRCEAENRRTEDTPVVTHWSDVLESPDSQAGRMMLTLLAEDLVTHVGIQALQKGKSLRLCHDRKHKEWMNEALSDGFERSKTAIAAAAEMSYGTRLYPEMSFELRHSQDEPCLWLSDWISWEVGRWFHGESLSSAFGKCAKMMTFLHYDDIGTKVETQTLGGNVSTEYPDYPRDIQNLCRRR